MSTISCRRSGCHLDRDTTVEVRRSGLEITRVRNFYLPKSQKFAGYMHLGAALDR